MPNLSLFLLVTLYNRYKLILPPSQVNKLNLLRNTDFNACNTKLGFAQQYHDIQVEMLFIFSSFWQTYTNTGEGEEGGESRGGVNATIINSSGVFYH